MAFFNLGEYRKALDSFKSSLNCDGVSQHVDDVDDQSNHHLHPECHSINNTSSLESNPCSRCDEESEEILKMPSLAITEGDKQRILIMIAKTKKSLKAQNEALEKQKQAMRRVFSKPAETKQIRAASKGDTKNYLVALPIYVFGLVLDICHRIFLTWRLIFLGESSDQTKTRKSS